MTPEQQNKLQSIKAALKQHIKEAEKATPEMCTIACRMALYAIETMEYDKQKGKAGAYNDLVSMLSIWEGGQP